MLSTLRYIFFTEVLLLWRRSQEWIYPLAFFFIVISLFPLALTPDSHVLHDIMPGGIWIAALLASLLSMENIFMNDLESGHLEQWMLSEIPFSLLIFIKMSAQWLVTQLPLVLLTPVLGCLFHLSFFTVIMLGISLLLGTPIITLMGSLCVALTLGLRQQGILLGLLLLPMITPVLIFGVGIVHQSEAGLSVTGPCAFLAGLCLLAITLLPWVIAAALKIAIDD